jgi:hypothetical protein
MSLRKIVGCLGLALVLLSACHHRPDDPLTATRQFFDEISAGHIPEAYESASYAFRALQTEAIFSSTAQDLGLVGGKLDTAEPVSADAEVAKVKANVVSTKGPTTFTVTLKREKGAWRIFSILLPKDPLTGVSENRFSPLGRTLAFNDTATQPTPDDQAIKGLVQDTMTDFAGSVARQDFSAFYKSTSKAWQRQISQEQLTRAFSGFIDRQVSLNGVADKEPIFDTPPIVSTDGLLMVSGHYATEPYEVIFVFKYLFEDPTWKLFGLDVNLRQAGTVPKRRR